MPSYTPVKLAFSVVVPKNGVSEKPPIIFAHGLSGSKEHWEDFTQLFADRTKRKVYAIDARNHGDSEWNDVFNFDCNVDDFLHFMDSEKISKAIIVGHSMGGITGIKMALIAPERVEKLIVEDMSVSPPPAEVIGMVVSVLSMLKNALQVLPKGVDEATAIQMLFSIVLSQIPEEVKSNFVKPESFQKLKIAFKRLEDGSLTFKANLDILLKFIKEAKDVQEAVEGVYEGPAFFLYGKLSPFHAHLDEPSVKKHFPKADITSIENATHTVHFDQPEEFAEAVLNFILKE
ncbi:hypothetical protein JTE90_011843 [Oedothorax gibbosus]|uniref:sn-1-specific diacylglycerol lipase ABHD11 n=1 Tax=Oedothorax gibbosus TaxID=931172 RepID=A0AAV6U1S4_9ARAC|nr:hypothetical protein JTE90_011843 [Oedothorax gibbosus]